MFCCDNLPCQCVSIRFVKDLWAVAVVFLQLDYFRIETFQVLTWCVRWSVKHQLVKNRLQITSWLVNLQFDFDSCHLKPIRKRNRKRRLIRHKFLPLSRMTYYLERNRHQRRNWHRLPSRLHDGMFGQVHRPWTNFCGIVFKKPPVSISFGSTQSWLWFYFVDFVSSHRVWLKFSLRMWGRQPRVFNTVTNNKTGLRRYASHRDVSR